MTAKDFYNYLMKNTYKVIQSTNPQHEVGKLFTAEETEEAIYLTPIDISADNKVMKLRPECAVGGDKIKGNDVTLHLVATL